MSILTEAEIADLLADPKPVSQNQVATLLSPRHPQGHDLYARVYVQSLHRRKFQLTARRGNGGLPHDFCLFLSLGQRQQQCKLIRCDGFHERHVNWHETRQHAGITEVPADTFHVHHITERYQRAKRDPLGYAYPTEDFWSFHSAVHFLCTHFGCYDPASPYPGGQRHPLL